MLKKSLLTAAILGVMVTTAGAASEQKIDNAQQIQPAAFELALDSQSAGCEANTTEAGFPTTWTSSLELQTSTQIGGQSTANGLSLWGGGRCMMCTPWG